MNSCFCVMEMCFAEKNEIENFCAANGYLFFLRDGELYIISANATAWRICPPKHENGTVYLLHESKYDVPRYQKLIDYPNRTYHKQNGAFGTIIGYLQYIRNHDTYDKERMRKTSFTLQLAREKHRAEQAIRNKMRWQERQYKKHGKSH